MNEPVLSFAMILASIMLILGISGKIMGRVQNKTKQFLFPDSFVWNFQSTLYVSPEHGTHSDEFCFFTLSKSILHLNLAYACLTSLRNYTLFHSIVLQTVADVFFRPFPAGTWVLCKMLHVPNGLKSSFYLHSKNTGRQEKCSLTIRCGRDAWEKGRRKVITDTARKENTRLV